MTCPECQSERVHTELAKDGFFYGPEAIKLRAVIPYRECDECGFTWMDWESEIAREKAVAEHLRKKE